MSIARQLGTAAVLVVRQLWRRMSGAGAREWLSAAELETSLQMLIDRVGQGVVKRVTFVDLPATEPPWFDTGLDLEAGAEVTTLASGRVWLSRALGLWVGPAFHLWRRVGAAGRIARGKRNTCTFLSAEGGRLYLGGVGPGWWKDINGGLGVEPRRYRTASGSMSVAVIEWDCATVEGLRRLTEQGDVGGLLAAELDRLQTEQPVPEGWHYLWELGPGEIYRQEDASGIAENPAPADESPPSGPVIHCHTQDDVGILQKAAAVPLTDSTRLAWRWKVDSLPCRYAEDSVPMHDYMSIAVEFDNGRDITFYWSASLPVGTHYHCPLPAWKDRETHVVVRSGSEGLGRWLSEECVLAEEYRRAIGGELPERVTRVWLIANSMFQKGEGRCSYAGIRLLGGDELDGDPLDGDSELVIL